MSSPVSSFNELGLSAPIYKALKEIGYETPSPIQSASIPFLLQGRDLLGQAQTGTGKTAAFALPLLHRLDLTNKQTQLLVLTPTRELAIQVAEALQNYARYMQGFHVMPIYGGQSMAVQLRQLKRGVHVIVGTPGRVMDHLRRKSLNLKDLRMMVLDEADEMLKMGFIEDVEWIMEQVPQQRQIALFSATMPAAIRKVTKRYLNNPEHITIKTSSTTVETIDQQFWKVDGVHKLDALTRILEIEDFDAALIFVRTKTATLELAQKLEARGFSSAALNGDMNQMLREKTVEQLKNKKLDIVVATDVAARGLDVTRITHVINYDIPYDTEAYVHRIGRTGRAGRAGKAILFVAPREMRLLRGIEKATNKRISSLTLPSSTDVSDRRLERFKQSIVETVQNTDLQHFESLVEQIKRDQGLGAEQVAAALIYQSQKDKPLMKKEKQAGRDSAPATRQQPKEKFKEKQKEKHKEMHKEMHKEKAKEQPKEQPKEKKVKSNKREHDEYGMQAYRVEVGENQGATAKDIVGAIANEAGLDSQYIGRIKIHDDFSTVELPGGMPKDIFQHLKKVQVCQCQLKISLDKFARQKPAKKGEKPRHKKPKSTRK